MNLRSLFAALTWRDAVCAAFGCRQPRGNAKYSFIHACERCGRYSFVEVRHDRTR